MFGDEIFWFGVIGGALPEFLRFYNKRFQFSDNIEALVNKKLDKRALFIKATVLASFFIITFTMIFLGGFFAYLYSDSGIELNKIAAIQIGASTPLVISALRGSFSDPG